MREDADLLHGDAAMIAEFLGVNVRTVKRWKQGIVALPVTCRKLLALRFEGDATALLGEGWQGFYFGRDGQLYLPSWKCGFNPDQIKAMFYQVQQVRALERQIQALKTEQLGRDFVRSLLAAALIADPSADSVRLDERRQRQHSDRRDE